MITKFDNKENILLKFFIEREGEGIKKNIKKIDLIDSGLLDSLDIVSLASFIQKEFKVKIDLTDDSTFTKMRKFKTILKKSKIVPLKKCPLQQI